MVVKTTFVILLVAVLSIGVGSVILSRATMNYALSESQGPYRHNVNFGGGVQAKFSGVVVDINLAFARTWFVGEERAVAIKVSAEKVSDVAQNFSWRIFWVELYTLDEGKWRRVGVGSYFLELETGRTEYHNQRLYMEQKIPVGTVNLDYLESVERAWFRIGIMMDIYNNNTEYSLTFYTPMGEIGPVTILSPLYSPASLAVICNAAIPLSVIFIHQLKSRIKYSSKRKLQQTRTEKPRHARLHLFRCQLYVKHSQQTV